LLRPETILGMGRKYAARKNSATTPASRGISMRARRTKDGLTVRAVAGSHVVLPGMNMRRKDCDGHQSVLCRIAELMLSCKS